MNTPRKFMLLLCSTILGGLSGAAVADVKVVGNMDIQSASFTLLPPATSPGYYPAPATNMAIGPDTNLVDGARNPVLGFDVTLSFLGTRTEDWSAVAYTTAASAATIDTTNNLFTIDLATLTTDWSGPRCPPALYPSCSGIAQNPAGNIVIGGWDPLTHVYTISWDAYIPGHPFPEATGSWTLSGIANPVPEPSQWILMLVGIGMVGGLVLRHQPLTGQTQQNINVRSGIT